MEILTEEKIKSIIEKNRFRIDSLANKIGNSFIEIDETLLLTEDQENRDPNILKVTVGFPFAMYNKNIILNDDFRCNNRYRYIFRGEIIRILQHKNYLKTILTNQLDYIYNSHDNVNIYKEAVKINIGDVKKILYVDPHNHVNGTNIGDSFISLYYPKAFSLYFRAVSVDIYTRSYQHFSSQENLEFHSYDELDICNFENYDLIIISDFIDVHSHFTNKILNRLSNFNNYKLILNGRNSYYNKNHFSLTHFKYNKDDPILTNKGIEDYMLDCSAPFIDNDISLMVKSGEKIKASGRVVFINPFTSKETRDLSPEMVYQLMLEIGNEVNDVQFYISRGFNQEKEKLWLNSFRKKLTVITITYVVSWMT